jgi:hypothetical protein
MVFGLEPEFGDLRYSASLITTDRYSYGNLGAWPCIHRRLDNNAKRPSSSAQQGEEEVCVSLRIGDNKTPIGSDDFVFQDVIRGEPVPAGKGGVAAALSESSGKLNGG